jgi:hypothetical protein
LTAQELEEIVVVESEKFELETDCLKMGVKKTEVGTRMALMSKGGVYLIYSMLKFKKQVMHSCKKAR